MCLPASSTTGPGPGRFTASAFPAQAGYAGPMAAVELPVPRARNERGWPGSPGPVLLSEVLANTGSASTGFTSAVPPDRLWLFDAGLACCAVECAAALSRVSGPGRPADPDGPPGSAPDGDPGEPRPGHVLIVAGTVTDKLAPLLLRAYQELPGPVFVLSFGACSNSGGPYWDSYCVTKGVDQLIPVDVYVPGCPPRPEALLHGLDMLAQRRLAGSRP